MISFAQLEKRTLAAKIQIDDEMSGTKEDFRIIFRDVSIHESRKLLKEVGDEVKKLLKPATELRKKITKAYEETGKAYNEIAALAGKNGNSPEKIKTLEKEIAAREKAIAGWEKEISDLPLVPTAQQLHLAKIVVDLPDLRGDTLQEVPPPTVETFMRLPYNMSLAMDAAIGERVNNIDEKK